MGAALSTSHEDLEISPGHRVRFTAGLRAPESVTLWSGALAFRVRWSRDREGYRWSADGCVGTSDEDDGDALRFDDASRTLREAYLNRPRTLRFDDATLRRVAELQVESGTLSLPPEEEVFSLAPADVALFDLTLDAFVALRGDVADALGSGGESPSLRAIEVSTHVALLFFEGRYAGWRARDPVSVARPMGWPETRDGRGLDDASRSALASLLYDWMVIDASARVEPLAAADDDDIAHMVRLRERARELAATHRDERDPTAGVARDLAAHVHWSWGFYRVGE